MKGTKPSLNNILHPPIQLSLLGRNILVRIATIRMLSQCSSLDRPCYIPQFYDVKGILENEAEMQIAITAAEWRILRVAAKSGEEVV